MSDNTIMPDGENLRRALRWISEKGSHAMPVIEEASIRFDLSPADADFLIRHFAKASTE